MSDAEQTQSKKVSEVRNAAVSFVGKLDVGELLIGVPTVTEVDGTDLTITNVAVSIIALTINGKLVPSGAAVQCRIGTGIAGTRYELLATATSNASPAQTLIVKFILNVVGD